MVALLWDAPLRAQSQPPPEPKPAAEAPLEIEEEITVTATRTGGRIEEQPTRVEVLTREEVEEKMMMTPGDIVMMLNEMGGMRVQATSPALGAATVRIQGMPGRYTRVLFDGLPLAGQQVGGLGLLQIPPMDLGQVEVIKGVASALYGAGAMGGVINLVARRPQDDPVRELLFNQSTVGATDAVAFLSGWLARRVGASLLAGGHRHATNDIDQDGWIDLPGYRRGVMRSRVFWDNGNGATAFATGGLTAESREGSQASTDTTRGDIAGTMQYVAADRYLISGRLAGTFQRHDHVFDRQHERDRHINVFAEFAVRGSAGRHTWVGGAAFERESFDPLDVPRFNYFHRVPGLFVQDDIRWNDWLSVSASARLDLHSSYGSFVSPRVSALAHKNGWTSRVSVGRGFFAATPLTEETEAAGLRRLSMPRPLEAETGSSYSIDVSKAIGSVSVTTTLFGSSVAHAIRVEREAVYQITNADDPSTTMGVELLGTFRRSPIAVTGNYALVRTREQDGAARVESPLTPRHSAGLVAMWEREDRGRVGVEYYFTGPQRLDANPYRSRSDGYSIVGVLAERKVGPVRLFINGENLTDVRQTKFDRLPLPSQAVDGRWTVDAWAPLDGRTFNGGVRIVF